MTLRPATARDVPAIGQIVNNCAECGLMLHRSLSFLYEHVRDFHVVTDRDSPENSPVIACCGLSIVWGNLAEVYSLVVHSDHRRRGLGRQLVQACFDDARRLGVRRLMALTYEKEFFTRLGFQIVDRLTLPLKVWSECLRCPKNQACDEIAMVKALDDVPEAPAAAPELLPHASSADDYFVPVVLRTSLAAAPRTAPDAAQPAPGA